MVERNMIKEGFVINTVTASGAVSGTQIVSIPQINALLDGNIVSSALTVSGGELIALDADMGTRWKLTRLEYHTDDIDVSNFSMNISDDNVDFFPVTFTGNAPLYIGDISNTTVSGSPRYIRFEHSPAASGAEALEWRAINDDTLVNFGSTGTQTDVNIIDSPIGKPSDSIQPLDLFNSFSKTANGFVFIENTGNDGDDNIEISTSQVGPWFGRNTNETLQPETTLFNEGKFSNTRVVSGTGFFQDFTNGSTSEWTGVDVTGFTNSGQFISATSTTTTPVFQLNPGFGNNFNSNYPTFRTDDFDTVSVTLTIPTLSTNDITEGPRLFWKTINDGFETPGVATEILSTTASGNFTGLEQKFIFNVGSMVTWSGVNVGFKIQLYTATSGTAIPIKMHDFEVYHSFRKERVALDLQVVPSGLQTEDFIDEGASPLSHELTGTGLRLVILSKWNRVTQPCVITKLSVLARAPSSSTFRTGVFLARFKEGGSFPSPGTNFEVKRVVRFQEAVIEGSIVPFTSTLSVVMELPVHWPADPGDFLGWTDEGHFSASFPFTNITRINYRLVSDPVAAHTVEALVRLDSINVCQTDLDAADFAVSGGSNGSTPPRAYAIHYDSVSAGDYFSAGTYETPIFDGGSEPSLLNASFESEVPAGTSIDVSGSTSFDTFNAKASSSPPTTGLVFGDLTGIEYRLNKDTPAVELTTFSINEPNSVVQAREGPLSGFEETEERLFTNMGASMLYHETKDELWVLNVLLSGTITNDIYPTWDRFDVASGNFLGTQALGGTVFYSYTHPSLESYAFEPAGFVVDYKREEIYIISRENTFFIGSTSYYGIRMDLDGTFINVIMKSGDLNLNTTDEDSRFNNCIDVAYDGTYFYLLTNDVAKSPEDLGQSILIIKTKNNKIDFNDMKAKIMLQINTIPNMSFANNDDTSARCIAYNSKDSNFYLAYQNVTGSDSVTNRKPNIFGISLKPDANDVFTADFVRSVQSEDLARDILGFSNIADIRNSGTDWVGARERKLAYFTDMVYIPKRDTFGILQQISALRSSDFQEDSPIVTDNYEFWRKQYTYFVEVDAGLNDPSRDLPALPIDADPVWGTNSGTLSYQQVQEDSTLFPTGRYAQMEYTLNANSGNKITPYLTSSKLAQGIRVGDIPSAGTKTIYLRTNIPAGSLTTDQSGSLKIFWELEE